MNDDAHHASGPAENRASRRPISQSRVLTRVMATLLGLAFLVLLYVGAGFILPVVLAVLLALIFQPLITAGRRLGIPSFFSAGILIVGLFAAGFYTVGALAEPARQWVSQAPTTLAKIESKLRVLKRPIEEAGRAAEQVQKLAEAQPAPGTPKEKVTTVTLKPEGLGLRMINGTLDAVTSIVSVAFLMFFLLGTEGRLLAKIAGFISHAASRESCERMLGEIEKQVSRCLALTTLINLGLGIAVGVALWIIGLPHPVMWGILVFVVNYVPYIGGAIGTVLVAFAGFVAFEEPWQIAAPALAYLVLNTIEGMIVTPMVLGRQFRVDPCFVFVWLMFWGWTWGVAGAVLAMPMLTAVKIICDRVESLQPVSRLIADDAREPRTAVGRIHRRLTTRQRWRAAAAAAAGR